VGDKGYFIEPTVFADVQDNMKIAQENLRAVMSILKFKDLTRSWNGRTVAVWIGAAVWTRHHESACHRG